VLIITVPSILSEEPIIITVSKDLKR